MSFWNFLGGFALFDWCCDLWDDSKPHAVSHTPDTHDYYPYDNPQDQMYDLQDEIDDLQDQIDAIQDNIDDLEDEIDDVEDEVDDLEDDPI